MSYATDVLRRRQEFKEAFQKRYNPAEDVLATLAEIDKEAFRREQLKEEAAAKDKLSLAEEERRKAAELRDVERFGLQKTQIIAQTKKAEADRTASDAALAASRQALADERAAREALRRQEQRFAEENRAKDAAAAQAYGVLQQGGLTTADVYQTPAMDKELRRVAEARGAETPSVRVGQVSESLDELAGAANMSREELLTRIQDIELERSKLGAGLGLTEAKTKKALEDAAAAARRGLPKPAKVLTPEEQQAAKEEAAYKKLRNERLRRALSEKGGFVPTEEEVNKMQTARRQVVAAQASTNVLRQLMKTYPEFASYVGPVDGLINRVKAKFGANSKQASDIQSSINRVFQAYKVATTGAAAGVLEMEDLKNIMPKETDSFDAILGKLDAAERMAQTSIDAIDLVLDKMDIRAADPLARAQVAAGEVVTPMPEAEAEQFFEETP